MYQTYLRLILCIILIAIVNVPVQASTIWYYVDTGASGTNIGGRNGTDPNDPSDEDNWTNAFTSGMAAEDALDGTFPAGHTCGLYFRSSDGSDDISQLYLYGWTNNPPIILDQYDFPVDGIPDPNKYNLKVTDATNLWVRQSNVTINRLQIFPQASTVPATGIFINDSLTGISINKCLIIGTVNGSYNVYGIQAASASDIINCIITGFNYDFKSYGVYSSANTNLFNCTLFDNFYGVRAVTGTLTMRNTAIGNCSDDVYSSGTYDMDYMVTDDDESANCANYHAFPTNGTGDWSLDFNNAASLDFSLKATAANLINHATTASAPADDIIDTIRPQGASDDISAFELPVSTSAPTVKPRITFINMY